MSVCTNQVQVVVCLLVLCAEIEHWMGESVSGPWTCAFDLFIVDEIKKGVFMFLGLLIDVSFTLLNKMDIQFFQ
jgi:hypothetical protein